MSESARDVLRHNLRELIDDGPGLTMTKQTCIVARGGGKVLVFGLGAMGVGVMWVAEHDGHKDRPGYAEARVVDDPERWHYNAFTGGLYEVKP